MTGAPNNERQPFEGDWYQDRELLVQTVGLELEAPNPEDPTSWVIDGRALTHDEANAVMSLTAAEWRRVHAIAWDKSVRLRQARADRRRKASTS